MDQLEHIRNAADPIHEICLQLTDGRLKSNEAVMTGCLTDQQIHQYVLFCMKQVIETSKKQHPVFKIQEVQDLLFQKMLSCYTGASQDLQNVAERLFVYLCNHEEISEREELDTLLHELAWALTEDPYEAHGWTGFGPLPYCYVKERRWGQYVDLPSPVLRDIVTYWWNRRAGFLVGLLQKPEKTVESLYSQIGSRVLSATNPPPYVPGFKYYPDHVFPDIPRGKTPAPPTGIALDFNPGKAWGREPDSFAKIKAAIGPDSEHNPHRRTRMRAAPKKPEPTPAPKTIQQLEAGRKKTSDW